MRSQVPNTFKVTEHADFKRVIASITRRMKQDSRFGILLLINPLKAIEDLGFSFSPAMRAHLLKKYGRPLPKDGTIYERVKDGTREISVVKRVVLRSE